MSTISEILTLDLNEDIKNVIDLEDRSENEIQQEIESYIVTEGLSKHLSMKKAIILTTLLFTTTIFAESFNQSKKLLKEIYKDHQITFYCGCKYNPLDK